MSTNKNDNKYSAFACFLVGFLLAVIASSFQGEQKTMEMAISGAGAFIFFAIGFYKYFKSKAKNQ